MKNKILLAGALFMLSITAGAQEKKESKLPDWFANVIERIELHGYGQAGYTWQHDKNGNTNTFDIKRTIFWATARITDRWSFLFMHNFSGAVQELYTDYRLSKGKELTVRFGQFKSPYSLENPISPTKLELIDCSAQSVLYLAGIGGDPLYGNHAGRDMGLMIFGDLFNNSIHYEVAIMNGQGINKKDRNNKKDVILHLEYLPKENFRVVATGQLGTGNAIAESVYNPEIAEGEDYTRNRWSAGAEWKSRVKDVDYWKVRPITVRGEVLGGKDGTVNSFGAYVTGSVPVCDALDVVGSADYFEYNRDLGMKQTNLMIGAQHWFHRSCRVQVQYVYSCPEGMDKENYGRLMTQLQIAF